MRKPQHSILDKNQADPKQGWFWKYADLAILFNSGTVFEYDLVQNERPTLNGTPTITSEPYLGTAAEFLTNEGLLYSKNRYTGTGRDITLAATIRSNESGGIFLALSSGNEAIRIQLSANVLRFVYGGVVAITSTVPITKNIPWFVAVGYKDSDGTIDFFSRRLDTGEINTQTIVDSRTWVAGDGTYLVGEGHSTGASDFDGRMGMACVLRRYMSLDEIRSWSDNIYGPWTQKSNLLPFIFASPAGDSITLEPDTELIDVTGLLSVVIVPKTLTPAAESVSVIGSASTVSTPRTVSPANEIINVVGSISILNTSLTLSPANEQVIVTGFISTILLPLVSLSSERTINVQSENRFIQIQSENRLLKVAV
ncbi:MAG: hypothetical protein E2O80_02020 [Betaproteobacteria bacterium]|nr:MAG: hypothetical protein E2O80_02020 [Betaproteobacteria bacterium]